MKAELSLADLQRVVRILTPLAAPAVRSRYAPTPVIGITADGPTVTFTAGTAAITGQVTLSAGAADGAVAVDAKQLHAAAGAVAAPGTRRTAPVTLTAEPGCLHLTAATTITVPAREPQPAPALPTTAHRLLHLPARDLIHTLTCVAKAANPRGYDACAGIRLHRRPGCCLDIEATDRMRIHRIVAGEPSRHPHSSWLPAATVSTLAKVLKLANPADQVTVSYGERKLLCTTATVTVAAHAAGRDSWPDVQHILEASIEPGAGFTAAVADLREAFRGARAASDPHQPVTHLDLDPGDATVTVTVPGPDRPMFTHTIAVTAARGSSARVAIRADHALDLLAAITAEQTTITIPDARNLLGVTAAGVHGVLVCYSRPPSPTRV